MILEWRYACMPVSQPRKLKDETHDEIPERREGLISHFALAGHRFLKIGIVVTPVICDHKS
jgi:hypothetical protein